jgi:hypothetical protein
VKVYVPEERPEIVVLVPDPLVITPDGSLVMVHVPLEGSPLSATVPVAELQVGCVIAPTCGSDGIAPTVRT